jgi:hypothetical protein
MTYKDLVTLCGRLGLITAAFALIVGIVASPLLQKIWPPPVTVAAR